MLFEPKKLTANENDPYMINPKGFKVLVPEKMVPELLKQGFVLVDKRWMPTKAKKDIESVDRDFPLSIDELHKEAAQEVDLLEITEI